MDFERIGNTLGQTQALEIMTDAAARQIDLAHAEIHKANAEIERLDGIIVQLQAQLADAQSASGVYLAHIAGVEAQLQALKAEVIRVIPQSPLLAKTGKIYPKGGAQTKLSTYYDAAFDAKARELNVPSSIRARRIAK